MIVLKEYHMDIFLFLFDFSLAKQPHFYKKMRPSNVLRCIKSPGKNLIHRLSPKETLDGACLGQGVNTLKVKIN